MASQKEIKTCAGWLKGADCILVGAGAGLSADAGIDYTDPISFAKNYPALVKKGFQFKLQLMGYSDWSEAQKWGYYAQHVNEARFEPNHHPVYGRLLEIVKTKDYFIITTNVDQMFIRNGFNPTKIYTPQGDYAYFQCLKPCSEEVWPIKPFLDKILPKLDHTTQEVTEPSLLPICPNCGGPVFLNVRGGDWFIHKPYEAQEKRYHDWLHAQHSKNIVLLEIGSGFNTPGWIRFPFERIARSLSNSRLIRINLNNPEIPPDIKSKAISIRTKAFEAITAIWQELGLHKTSS